MSHLGFVAICLHWVVGAFDGGEDHRPLRDRWLAAVKSSLENFPNVTGRMMMSDKSPDASKQLHWEIRFALEGKRIYAQMRSAKRVGAPQHGKPFEGRGSLWISSDAGHFVLSRAADNVEYSLAKRYRGRETMESSLDFLWDYLLAGTRLYRCPFVELLQDPGFRIVSETTVGQGADRIARVRFMLDSEVENRRHILGGELDLLANRSFALRRAELKVGAKNGSAAGPFQTHRTTIDYGESIEGMPFPKKVVHSFPGGSHSGEILEVTSGTLPNSVYAQSTYGIDEKPAAAKNNRFEWLIACGIVLSLISLVGWHRTRPTGPSRRSPPAR